MMLKEKKNIRFLFVVIGINLIFQNVYSFLAITFIDNATSWFKYTVVLEYIICVIIFLKSSDNFKYNYYNYLSFLFLMFIPISSFVGLINQNYTDKFIVHIYMYTLPVITFCVADHLLDAFINNISLQTLFHRFMKIGAITYIISVALYRILGLAGLVHGASFGSASGAITFCYFLCGNKKSSIVLTYILLIAILFSSKRAPLLAAIIIFIVFLIVYKKQTKYSLFRIICFICGIIVIFYVINKTPYFDRVVNTVNKAFGEDQDWNYVTSGRTSEIEYIVSYINEMPIQWLSGCGYGVMVQLEDLSRHYSHFTPLTYVLVSGIFFSMIVYIAFFTYLTKLIIYIKKKCVPQNVLFIVFIMTYYVITSFTGGTMINTIEPWLYIAMGAALLKKIENKKRKMPPRESYSKK